MTLQACVGCLFIRKCHSNEYIRLRLVSSAIILAESSLMLVRYQQGVSSISSEHDDGKHHGAVCMPIYFDKCPLSRPSHQYLRSRANDLNIGSTRIACQRACQWIQLGYGLELFCPYTIHGIGAVDGLLPCWWFILDVYILEYHVVCHPPRPYRSVRWCSR